VTLTRVTNDASCNWVNLVQVSSVQFTSAAVNSAIGKQQVFRTLVRVLQLSSVQFSPVVCCEHGRLKKQYCSCIDSPAVALFTGPRGRGGTERHRRHVHGARELHQSMFSRQRYRNPATFPRTDTKRLRPADLFAEFTDTRWHQLRRYRMGRNSE